MRVLISRLNSNFSMARSIRTSLATVQLFVGGAWALLIRRMSCPNALDEWQSHVGATRQHHQMSRCCDACIGIGQRRSLREDEVRDRLFKTRASDLIQFTGHCKISEKGLGDLEMAAANSCAWWISGS
jgi:hypothetical protein